METEQITNAINQMRDNVVAAINAIETITPEQLAAVRAAFEPSATNPFATIHDIPTVPPMFYSIMVQAAQISIADNSTIYWDNKARNAETDTNNAGLIIPKSGIIRIATIMSYTITSVWGSGEPIPVYIRINRTTDHLIGSQSIVSPNRLTRWNKFDFNIPVVAGDILQIKTAFPDFVTVPGSTSWAGNILIEY